MKVLFWAPIHGQAGTTSNVLVSSLITGLDRRKKVVLTQTHFNCNNLEAPIVGANSDNLASKEYFREVGVDTLIRCFKAERLNKEMLERCCISLTNTNLLLLPGTSQTIRESFEFEMDAVMINLLKAIEEHCDVVFADISSGENALSRKLMKEANLVVVNLSQNMGVLDLYLDKFRENMPDKIFYLFGNYDCNSKYNINNVRKMYHKHINVKNSGVIPYNTGFMDAQVDGKVVKFIRNNLQCTKKDDNHYFMLKAKSATEKILKMAGM